MSILSFFKKQAKGDYAINANENNREVNSGKTIAQILFPNDKTLQEGTMYYKYIHYEINHFETKCADISKYVNSTLERLNSCKNQVDNPTGVGSFFINQAGIIFSLEVLIMLSEKHKDLSIGSPKDELLNFKNEQEYLINSLIEKVYKKATVTYHPDFSGFFEIRDYYPEMLDVNIEYYEKLYDEVITTKKQEISNWEAKNIDAEKQKKAEEEIRNELLLSCKINGSAYINLNQATNRLYGNRSYAELFLHSFQKWIEKNPEYDIKIDMENKHYDDMNGIEFEKFCAELLIKNGFIKVETTSGSGDYGVDILTEKDGVSYAIQCKRYSTNIGNTAVQEIYSGKEFYKRHIGVVLTNQYFTPAAKETAECTGILLWDRNYLEKLCS